MNSLISIIRYESRMQDIVKYWMQGHAALYPWLIMCPYESSYYRSVASVDVQDAWKKL